jgi:hypothetical protein
MQCICVPSLRLKITVFWDVAPYSLEEVYRRFRDACCLYHQGDNSLRLYYMEPSVADEIADLNLNPETGYIDVSFSWFSSIYQGKYWNIASKQVTTASFHILLNSLVTTTFTDKVIQHWCLKISIHGHLVEWSDNLHLRWQRPSQWHWRWPGPPRLSSD